MTCDDTRELFTDWTDETLTTEDRVRVQAHLAQCADCRKELERFTDTIALLHRMERPRAPVGFVDRVLAVAQPAPWYRRFLQRFFLPLSVKLPAEAAALLLVAGLAVYVFQQSPELQRAARQEAFRPVQAPAVVSSAPPAEVPSTRPHAFGDRLSTTVVQAERKKSAAPEDARRSAADELPRVVSPSDSPSPAGAAAPSGEHRRELLNLAPSTSASPPPPGPAEEDAKTAPPSTPRMRAATPAPSGGAKTEVEKSAKAKNLDEGAAQESALSQLRSAPAEGRSDSPRDKTAPSLGAAAAPPRSAVRVLPSGDVVGRLTVKDRDSAARALVELLARSGGALISRREDAGTTVVEVAVPKTAYLEFSQGLARIGVWRPEGEPSDQLPNIRVTLRLVE
jgi:hypothetical protein